MKKGFTLIELVIVIAILGILAAIAIPKYVDLTSSAKDASAKGMAGAAKSALAIYLGENSGTYPTVTQLAANVQGATAAATGLQVTVGSQTCTIPTYTDTTCATATAAVGNTVRCVGDIVVASCT